MIPLSMTVNGGRVSAEVEPRTHLADFLRETLLLTGTHLGCEHGVCGACTVLLNNEPVRACITYAALCDGASVRSIEGLEDDPVAAALRAAFQAEHALQCGYCTPGMLVTARDIVLRLPDGDDDRIRLELAGNLCRCTGYNGIVRAIRTVLDAGVAEPAAPPAAIRAVPPVTVADSPPPSHVDRNRLGVMQTVRIGLPAATVWTAIQDPGLVAGCIPGASLIRVDGNHIEGDIVASLGPIQARFAGHARLSFDQDRYRGQIVGAGKDRGGGTNLSGEAVFSVEPDGPDATLIRLDITYALQGALAQFGRGPVVQAFAAEIVTGAARALEAKLRGGEPPESPSKLNAAGLLARVIWQTLRGWLKRRES